ncbi:SGNH/GDSL hydrolase family protein [Rhizobium azibense]|uniref:Lysophospholipase L1-like esterase n=1 Tax=Rhizobium azibense TaxID=1136135 RepID=A0A4R3RF19_9HYPH|nr:SGNH/GDSL hydrolase family protein [Rhizobium azibense]TCU34143.1 lysophospholipase L1-like esterase [Rhizobium azibense]
MTLYIENVVPTRGRRLGVIGTSLVQQNDLGATGSSNKASHSSRGWLSWARFYGQGLFDCPIWYDPGVYVGWEPSGVAGTSRLFQGLNAGVSGQTISEIDARKSFLVENVDCDIVLIDAGTNDAASLAKEVNQAGREALADYYLSYGKIVVLLPILARTTAPWPGGGTTRARANWINAKSRDFCRTRRNCYHFDWNEPWVDAASQYGTPIAGYTADGTHTVPKGGEAIGKALVEFLKTILPAGSKRVSSPDDKYSAADNPRGNLLANPFLTGTTGTNGTGSSGTVADGMRVERALGASTVVASLEARPNRGFWQVMTITPSGGAEDKIYFRTNSADTPHSFPNTEWVQASCELETNDYAGFVGATLALLDMNGGTALQYSYGMEVYNNGSANEKWAAQARSGLLLTPPMKIATGSTALRWRLEVTFDASVAGTPIVKCGAVELRPVQDPRTLLNWSAPI